MELDELKKMKDTVENAARDVEQSIQTSASEFEEDLAQAAGTARGELQQDPFAVVPAYRHPGKNWRLKKGAMPQWYKARSGVRTKALSGAARVARYRPQKFH
jgi:sec-independent protein translocase protein TatB